MYSSKKTILISNFIKMWTSGLSLYILCFDSWSWEEKKWRAKKWCIQHVDDWSHTSQPVVPSHEAGGRRHWHTMFWLPPPPKKTPSYNPTSSAHSPSRGLAFYLGPECWWALFVQSVEGTSQGGNRHWWDLLQLALGVINSTTGLNSFEISSFWKIKPVLLFETSIFTLNVLKDCNVHFCATGSQRN